MLMWKDHFKKHDWTLTIVLCLFCAVSLPVIYSATLGGKFEGSHVSMAIYYVVGFIAMFVMGMLDQEVLKKLAIPLYSVGLGLLLLVLVLGKTVNTAKGWLFIGSLSFQPAEMVKLFLVLMLARFLAARQAEGPLSFARGVLPVFILGGVPFLLVLVQPDLGNAMAFVFIVVSLIWVGGMRMWHFLLMTGLVAGLLFTSVHFYMEYHDPLKSYLEERGSERWVERIDTFLYPDKVDPNVRYHIDRAEQAIGSGGLTGEGYMQGNAQRGFVPYVYADSIFVVVAEEFGFRGGAFLIMLYMILLYRIVMAAVVAKDPFSRLLAVGVASLFLFQIFQNIGMHLRLMPLTGITLPFISFGGTSLLTNMLAIGIVQSVYAQRDREASSWAVTSQG